MIIKVKEDEWNKVDINRFALALEADCYTRNFHFKMIDLRLRPKVRDCFDSILSLMSKSDAIALDGLKTESFFPRTSIVNPIKLKQFFLMTNVSLEHYDIDEHDKI